MAQEYVLNRRRQVPAEDTPAFGGIAERFRRAGDLDRAVALCQEGLLKFPDHLSARVTLGWALLDLGRYEEAREALESALKRAPDNLAAIRGLAELHDRAEHTMLVPMDGPGQWPPDQAVLDSLDVDPSADVMPAPADVPLKPGEPLSLDSLLSRASVRGKGKKGKKKDQEEPIADAVIEPANEAGGMPAADVPLAREDGSGIDLEALVAQMDGAETSGADAEEGAVDLGTDVDIETALQQAQAAAEQAAAEAAAKKAAEEEAAREAAKRKSAEEKAAAEVAARQAAEERAAAEEAARRKAEERAAAEAEARRAAEEQAAAEAAAKRAMEKAAAEAAARHAAEEKAAAEAAARRAAEEKAAAAAAAHEAAEQHKAAVEAAARQAAEQKAAAEAAARRAAEEKKTAEEAATRRLNEEKAAGEAAAREAAGKIAAEAKARQAAEEKTAAEAKARKAAEEKMAAEAAARREAEKAAAETSRKAAEDRAAAETAARKAAEERAAAETAARHAAEEKAAAEAAMRKVTQEVAVEVAARRAAEERATAEATAREAAERVALDTRPALRLTNPTINDFPDPYLEIRLAELTAFEARRAAGPWEVPLLMGLAEVEPVTSDRRANGVAKPSGKSSRKRPPVHPALPELEAMLRRVQNRRTQLMSESVA